MKRHTRIYFDFFGFSIADTIGCEVCGQRATDIHHIKARGMGGDPKGAKDVIENLMALCRSCHEKYGDKKQYLDYLQLTHKSVIEAKTAHR